MAGGIAEPRRIIDAFHSKAVILGYLIEMQRVSLPVSEDMRFQERSWLLKRVGRSLLAIFVLLALCGAFSNGVLSIATAEREGVPLTADYERFQRRSAQTHFAIRIPKPTEDEIWLRLGRVFQETYEIEAVQPVPVRSNTGDNGINLFFDAYDQGDMQILIRARPRRFGAVTIEITKPPGLLQMPVLIYP
jgi:hypothetical protein